MLFDGSAKGASEFLGKTVYGVIIFKFRAATAFSGCYCDEITLPAQLAHLYACFGHAPDVLLEQQ